MEFPVHLRQPQMTVVIEDSMRSTWYLLADFIEVEDRRSQPRMITATFLHIKICSLREIYSICDRGGRESYVKIRIYHLFLKLESMKQAKIMEHEMRQW